MKKYRDYRTAIARTLTMIQPTDEGLAKGAKAIQEILNLALDPDTIVDSDNTRIARLVTHTMRPAATLRKQTRKIHHHPSKQLLHNPMGKQSCK
ncbi:hypothetical protein R5R70_13455 [Lactiplantibacillus plantarum]|uniref:hypothetical protein n=1 Tax=Lactiplantibacillus plantarum TaxID=1590 RepID=UPI00298D035A|nr:hypothetical protein [Lactiplantibacillus plantarum]WPB51918.1 hypothetical protein R5R70_13455 [Lactiplantibacillus plantarum]